MFQSSSSNSETLTGVRTFGHFQSFFSKIWLKKHSYINQLPWKPNKTYIMNSTSFLPLIDSSNGLPKLKFVESTVFEIIAPPPPPPPHPHPPFIKGVGTKYLCKGRVKADVRYLFLQIMCRLSNCVYKSKLASDTLDSCKKVNYRDYFFKILAVLLVCFVQSIIVQIESVLHLGKFTEF